MWCRHCKIDVPAVARWTAGPMFCSNCEREIAGTPASGSSPADTGVELASYDTSNTSPVDLSPPVDFLESEESRDRLRWIGRTLRSKYRRDVEFGNSPVLRTEIPSSVSPPPAPPVAANPFRTRREESSRTLASWTISMLLAGGMASFAVGVCLLVWSASFQLPRVWQWGLTTTIAAEGALIVGLVSMAARLWRNSRRLNRQMHGVDRQLHEIQHFTGSLAGNRLSGSQHYYNHFNQAASSHLLVANLRGQVDQLADRLAAES